MSGSIIPSRFGRWVGFALGDTVLRLAIQVGVTAVLARLVDPQDFGASALALSIIAVVATFVGCPFEEALAQTRVLRRPDIEAALAVSLATAGAGIAVCAVAGLVAAQVYGRPDLAAVLPAGALLLVPQALLHIAVMLGRRRRRFELINVANLGGHAVGAAAALALGLAGHGIWALVGFRVVTVLATTLWLCRSLRYRPGLRWQPRRVIPYLGFARTVVLGRLVENATYLGFAGLVGQVFGLAALGFVNMALRVVEPVRGAVMAITHNLTFALFKAAGRGEDRLAAMVEGGVGQAAAITAPVFMGLAVVSPLLVPILAGPGWEDAVPIAVLLAVGGMVMMPGQILVSALATIGQPQHALHASLLAFAVLTGMLLALVPFGIVAIGIARLLADAVQALSVVGIGVPATGASRTALLRRLAGPWGRRRRHGPVRRRLPSRGPARTSARRRPRRLGPDRCRRLRRLPSAVRPRAGPEPARLLARASRPRPARKGPPVSRGRVLVTGAGGFIGSVLVRVLAAQGRPVAAGLRSPPRAALPPGASAAACDLDRPDEIGSALAGAASVVHAAYGEVGRMEAQLDRLLRAADAAGLREIVFLSSIAVYGDREGVVTEDVAPDGRLDGYGAAKLACERRLADWARDGRRAVALRPGIVYGPGSPLWVEKMRRRLEAGVLGDLGPAGEGIAALVHVEDVAAAVDAALAPGPAGFSAANVVGPEVVTWNAYFRHLAAASGLPEPRRLGAGRLRWQGLVRVPALALARLGLGAAAGPALAPGQGERRLFARKAVYAGARARDLLGWQARIPVADGLGPTESG
ncbi:MAG: oligosaccharide flippase family protein [Methylobacterium frigidaeris]